MSSLRAAKEERDGRGRVSCDLHTVFAQQLGESPRQGSQCGNIHDGHVHEDDVVTGETLALDSSVNKKARILELSVPLQSNEDHPQNHAW